MERLRNAVSARKYSLLKTAPGQLCRTDKAKNCIAMRALRGFLLALTLIPVFVDLFRVRELLRGFITVSLDGTSPSRIPAGVDWSHYAYYQYVTNED
jgi:hypothetical protein